MKKSTKLFKIGEYAQYGMWRLSITGAILTCQGIDYSEKAMHGIEQVEETEKFDLGLFGARNEVYRYLADVSTDYWAEEMLDWVESIRKFD